jgi:hypothetical protein
MKILFSFLLLGFALSSFGQAKIKTAPLQNAYLLKSKKQKTIALVLLAGGAALVAAGMAIPEGEVVGHYLYPDWSDRHKNDNLKAMLSVTGVLSMVGSIPFFIASSKNKLRALTRVSFNNQEIFLPRQNSFVSCVQPTLTLRIGL